MKKKSLVQFLDLDEDHSADLPSSGTASPRLRTADRRGRVGRKAGRKVGRETGRKAGSEAGREARGLSSPLPTAWAGVEVGAGAESELEPEAPSPSAARPRVAGGCERAHGRGQRRSS